MTTQARLKLQEDCIVHSYLLLTLVVGCLHHMPQRRDMLATISEECEKLRQKVEALTLDPHDHQNPLAAG